MPLNNKIIWMLVAALAFGSGQAVAHNDETDDAPLVRSAQVADYDDDDEDPIYWEHDDDEGGPWDEVLLSAGERATIQHFYREHFGPAEKRMPPPGLKKEAHWGGQLPPNWRNRVSPQHMITTDVYAGAYAVPAALIRELPPQPAGTMLIEVGNRIARIYNETRRVADYVDY